MDFHTLKRKELQALCKKHSIPANLTNSEMADRLTSLLKVNEKPKPQGRSCLKSSDEIVVIVDSDTENKPHKKVKFSPDNQLFEYTEIDPRGKRRMTRRNSRSRDVGQNELPPSGSADSLQLNKEVVTKPVRVTRSRTHSSIDDDLDSTTNPHLEKKKGRKTRGQITEGDEVVESGLVSVQGAPENIEGYELNEKIVKNPVRVTRGMARTLVNNDLDSDTNHPVEMKRGRKPRKKIVESDEVDESSLVPNQNLTVEVEESSLVPNQTPPENVERFEPIDDIVKNPVRVTRAMVQTANDGLDSRGMARTSVNNVLDSATNRPVEKKRGRKPRKKFVESDVAESSLVPNQTHSANVERFEPIGDIVKNPVRVTRALAQTANNDLDSTMNPPVEKKKGRKLGEVVVESDGVKLPPRRLLRTRDVVQKGAGSIQNPVDKRGKKRAIDKRNEPQSSDQEGKQPVNSEVLGGETAKVETNGEQRATRLRKGIKIANANSKISSEIEVQREAEVVVVQVKETLRRTSRNNDRRKSVVSLGVNEDKKDDKMGVSVLISASKYLNMESKSNYPLKSQDESVQGEDDSVGLVNTEGASDDSLETTLFDCDNKEKGSNLISHDEENDHGQESIEDCAMQKHTEKSHVIMEEAVAELCKENEHAPNPEAVIEHQGEDGSVGLGNTEGASDDSLETSLFDCGNNEKGSNLISHDGENDHGQESIEDGAMQEYTEKSPVIMEGAVAELCTENEHAPNPEAVIEHQGEDGTVGLGNTKGASDDSLETTLFDCGNKENYSNLTSHDGENDHGQDSNEDGAMQEHTEKSHVIMEEAVAELCTENEHAPNQEAVIEHQGEYDSVGLDNTEGASDDSLETSLFDCDNKERGSNLISHDGENDHGQESIEDGAMQEHTETSHVIMEEAVAELCTENEHAPNPEAVIGHQGEDDSVGLGNTEGAYDDSLETSLFDCGNKEKGSNLISHDGENDHGQVSIEDGAMQEHTEKSHVILEEAVAELCTENEHAPNPEAVIEHQACISVDLCLSSIDRSISQSSLHIDETEQESTRPLNEVEMINQDQSPELVCENESYHEENVQISTNCEETNDGFTETEQGGYELIDVVKIDQGFKLNNPEGVFDDSIETCVLDSANEESSELISRGKENDHAQGSIEDGFGLEWADMSPVKMEEAVAGLCAENQPPSNPTAVLEHQACVLDYLGLSSVDRIFSQSSLKCIDETGQVSTGQLNEEESFNQQDPQETVYEHESKREENLQISATCEEHTKEGSTEIEQEELGIVEVGEIDQGFKLNSLDGASHDSIQTSVVDYANDEKDSNLISNEGEKGHCQESTQDCAVQDHTEISHVIMTEVVAGFCTENEPTPRPQALLEHQGIPSQSSFKCIEETEQVCKSQFDEEEKFSQEYQEMVCKGESKCNGNTQISTACEENTNAESTEILQVSQCAELELNSLFATPLGREKWQMEEDIYSHARMTGVAMPSVNTTSENAGVISEHVECQETVAKSNEIERCIEEQQTFSKQVTGPSLCSNEDTLKNLCATPVSNDHRSVSFGQLETREMMNGEESCDDRSNDATVSLRFGISSKPNIPLKSRDETEKGVHELIKVATVNHSYKLNTPECASDNSNETSVSDYANVDNGSKLISQEGQNDHGEESTEDGAVQEHTETSHAIKEKVVAGLCIEHEHTPKPDIVLEHQACDSGNLGLSSIDGIFSQSSFKYIDEIKQVSTIQLNQENMFDQKLSQEMGCEDENKCKENVHISTTWEENTNEGSTETEQESELSFLFATPLSRENPQNEREIFSHAKITGLAVSIDGADSENVLGIFDNVEHQADAKPKSNEQEKWNDLPFADAIGKDKDGSIFRNEVVGEESKETVKDESRIEEPNEPSGAKEISIAPVVTIDAAHSTPRNTNDIVSNAGEFSIQSHAFSSWEVSLFAEQGEVHETEQSENVISPILSEIDELREEQLLTEGSRRSCHIDEALEESKVECEEETLLSSKNSEQSNVVIVDQSDASLVQSVQDQVICPPLCGNGDGDLDERSIDGEMNDVGSNEKWHGQLKNLFATPVRNDHGSVGFGQLITPDIMGCEETYYCKTNENWHAEEKEPSKCNGAPSVDEEEDSRNVPDYNSSEFQGVIDMPFVNAAGKYNDGSIYKNEIVGDENKIKKPNEASGDNEISIIPDATVVVATPKNSYDLVSNVGEECNEADEVSRRRGHINEALEQSNVEIEEEKPLSSKNCEEFNEANAVGKDKDGSIYRNGFVGDELKEVVKDENGTEPNDPLGDNKISITPDGTGEASQATLENFNDFVSNAGEWSIGSHMFSSWEVNMFAEHSDVHEDGKTEVATSPVESDVNELKEEQLLTEVSRKIGDISEALEQSKVEDAEEKPLSSKNGEESSVEIVNQSDSSLDLDVQGNVHSTDLPFAEVVESEKDVYADVSLEAEISMTLDGNTEESLGTTHNSTDMLASAGEFNEFSGLEVKLFAGHSEVKEVEKSNVEASTNISCGESKVTQLCEEELLTVSENKDDKPNQDQSVSHLAFQGDADEDVQFGGLVQTENTSGKAEEGASPYSKKFHSTTMKAKTKRANLVRGTPNKLFLEDMKENAQSFKREPRTDAKPPTKRRALGQL